jgi:hypothetical protein
MDRRGKILASPGDPPFKAGTLVTTIKAKDEAGLRRDYDFKGLALVLRAEREALSRTFRLVIDGLPDSPRGGPCSSACAARGRGARSPRQPLKWDAMRGTSAMPSQLSIWKLRGECAALLATCTQATIGHADVVGDRGRRLIPRRRRLDLICATVPRIISPSAAHRRSAFGACGQDQRSRGEDPATTAGWGRKSPLSRRNSLSQFAPLKGLDAHDERTRRTF